jgi:hypothetical protein
VAVCLVLAGSLPPAADAQVGHRPDASPYREIAGKYSLTLFGGQSWGSGGKVEVGPGGGPLGGARFDLHLAGPGAIQLGLALGSFDRVLLNPSDTVPENRVLGTTSQSVILVDGGLNFVFTGEKTWHGLAPYLGASLGLALGGDVPEDTLSGFTFSTKFIVGPQLGVRWHITDRVLVRFEARDVIWRLSYPGGFFELPEGTSEDVEPLLDPRFNKQTQWTHNPMLLAALGWVF